jgi:flavin-dependent dehydrogenase
MHALLETDVCVVGGGPAGSAIARKLALLGHQVCLVEKAAFPRSHLGESFPPSILKVLDLFEVREQIEAAGFFRPQRSLTQWSSAEAVWQSQPGDAGFQVDRGRFDQLLLEAARAVGVRVLQPARAARPVSQGTYQWSVPVHCQDGQTTIKAQFLVSAAGRQSAFYRHQQPHQVSTVALYGYWQGTQFQDCESCVEAGSDEWFWGALLPNGRFNAAVFLDAKRYAAAKEGTCEQLYRSLLAKSNLLKGCLNGRLVTPVQIADASFFLAKDPIGGDWIKVGDAAFAIDPLSSQGVQMAMMSAFQGSIAVHTLLTEPEHADAAIDFYRNKLQETVARSQKAAAQIYATQKVHLPTAFWQQRSQYPSNVDPIEWEQNTSLFEITDPIRLSASASLMPVPALQGHSIRVINALHHPGLGSAVAYLGNVAIASLLEPLVAGQTVLELMQQWSKQHDLATCWQVVQWLWFQHIIVRDTEGIDEKPTRTDTSRL